MSNTKHAHVHTQTQTPVLLNKIKNDITLETIKPVMYNVISSQNDDTMCM